MADTFIALLDKRKPEIQDMLAKWITPERFFSMARQIQKNPMLANCTPESLVECVIQAAQAGLEIGGPNGHFYPVPYGKEAQGQPGWRGLAFLKLKAGAILQLDCDVVFADDLFEVGRSTDGDIFRHIQNFKGDRSERSAYASYARVKLPTGEYQFEVQSKDSILRHRSHSKQPDGLLWKKFWEEGWRKTAYRVLDKRLPEGVNPEAIERYMRAISIDARTLTVDDGPDGPEIPDDLPNGDAGVAQPEEQDTRNVQVGGSTPPASSKLVLRPDSPSAKVTDEDVAALCKQWRDLHKGKIAGFDKFLFDAFNVEDAADLTAEQFSQCVAKMAEVMG